MWNSSRYRFFLFRNIERFIIRQNMNEKAKEAENTIFFVARGLCVSYEWKLPFYAWRICVSGRPLETKEKRDLDRNVISAWSFLKSRGMNLCYISPDFFFHRKFVKIVLRKNCGLFFQNQEKMKKRNGIKKNTSLFHALSFLFKFSEIISFLCLHTFVGICYKFFSYCLKSVKLCKYFSFHKTHRNNSVR